MKAGAKVQMRHDVGLNQRGSNWDEENRYRFKKGRNRDNFQKEYKDIAKFPNFLLYSTSIYQKSYSCMLCSEWGH